MIKLTALNYKFKESSLVKIHGLKEYTQSKLFNWERELEKSQTEAGDGKYVEKPYIEIIETTEEDYVITERPIRLRDLEAIRFYKENEEGRVEIFLDFETFITVKETIEEIDALYLDSN